MPRALGVQGRGVPCDLPLLIKGTMMRHAREQRTVCDDQPLVPLPPLTTRWVGVDLAPNASETYVARRIELYAAETPHHHLVQALQRASTFCTDDVLRFSVQERVRRQGDHYCSDAADVSAA